MSGNVKQTVGVGEKFPVSFTVKNIGTETLKSHLNAPNKPESLRLAFLGNATQFNSANKPQLQPTSVLDANGLMEDDTIVYRDLFDTKIMGCMVPRPSDVIYTFKKLYNEKGAKAATDWYYAFSQNTDYIRRYRIKKEENL